MHAMESGHTLTSQTAANNRRSAPSRSLVLFPHSGAEILAASALAGTAHHPNTPAHKRQHRAGIAWRAGLFVGEDLAGLSDMLSDELDPVGPVASGLVRVGNASGVLALGLGKMVEEDLEVLLGCWAGHGEMAGVQLDYRR